MTVLRDRVAYEVRDGVADVRLSRAEKLNALDGAMFSALVDTGEALASDRSVRAVVLSGEGRGFCAGLDLSVFQEVGEGRAGATGRLADRLPGKATNVAQQAVRAWADLVVPTIAAVHGVALGGGLQVALGADLRIVAPDARLSVLEIRWGFVPDMTGTWILPRLVGLDVAKELTWTGRMVSGEEAVRLGLATAVAEDPRAAALELAGRIAGANPDAIQMGKTLLDTSLGDSMAEHFLRESDAAGRIMGSPNQREAVMAYFEERAPVFADPPSR